MKATSRNHWVFALVLLSNRLPATRVTAGDCQPIPYFGKSPPFPRGFPGSRDLSFHSTNQVNLVVAQPNGKMIILQPNGLARLNANGSQDADFVADIAHIPDGTNDHNGSSGIFAIALQPDGKILVTGNFNLVNGSRQLAVARLNPNGSSDESFSSPFTQTNLTPSPFYGPWLLALQPDGKVLVTGGFVSIGQISRHGMARLNFDGSLDPTFSPDPLFLSQDLGVNAITVEPNQKVLIGASYGMYRLNEDGSLDADFGDGSGLQGYGVGGYRSVLALQPDGKLLAGGFGLARFHAGGTLDDTFQFAGTISCGPSAIALQPNGKILVGGRAGGLVRVHLDGGLDSGFDLAAGLTEDQYSEGRTTVAIQADGQVLVGGIFTSFQFDNPVYLLRVNGGEWPTILPRSPRRLASGEFQFQATGPTNQAWIIQASTNLTVSNWTPIATNTMGTESLIFTDSGAANTPSRFYRAVLNQ